MNAVFAAQRKDIPIDVCQLAFSNSKSSNSNSSASIPSLALSQASALTKSIYVLVEKKEMLLHYLLVCDMMSLVSTSSKNQESLDVSTLNCIVTQYSFTYLL